MSSNTPRFSCASFIVVFGLALPLVGAGPEGKGAGTWPERYSVRHDDAAGSLTLSTPYYTVQQDLK